MNRPRAVASKGTSATPSNRLASVAAPETHSTPTLLWERLRGLFTPEGPDGGPGEDAPPRRGVVLALCVLTSTLLWAIFSLQETYTAVLQLPTDVVQLPPGRALTELPPNRVDVQVQGEGIPLLRLYYNPPTIPINAAAEQVNLELATPELPKNVRIESVSPRVLTLRTEPVVTRTVPIELRANIRTPGTHDLLMPPGIEPDSVRVTGARSIVEGLRAWPTEAVTVNDLTDSVVLPVPLADTLAGLARRSADAVVMTAVSREFTEGRREIEVDVTGAPPNDAVALVPPTVDVVYNVLLSDYERAQSAPDFFVTVSYNDIRADTTGRIQPRLHLPADVVLRDVEIEPTTLRYYNVLVDG